MKPSDGLHVNGFVALPSSFCGLQEHFHLGYKFEAGEADQFGMLLRMAGPAMPEPCLALYVSVAHKEFGAVPLTLHFARTRSHFLHGLHATADDQNSLLQAAAPAVAAALEAMLHGQAPAGARSFIWC